jgi:phosphate transport system substrate-binding protein
MALLIVVVAVLSSCGGTDDLVGQITIVGSSTARPFLSLVAGDFVAKNTRVDISISAPGTGDGIFLFCDGRSAIAPASRPMTTAEKKTCNANGVSWTELPIALDALVVVVDPDTNVACVTRSDLYALTGPEAVHVDAWSGAAPLATSLGSSTKLPDTPLAVVAGPEDSGTNSLYVDLVIAGIAGPRGKASVLRTDYTRVASDPLVPTGVQGAPGRLGIVGFSPWQEAPRGARALAVNFGKGCVPPNFGTIASGRYPLSRKLFLYVNRKQAEANNVLRAFVDYAVRPDVLEQARAAGAVPLTTKDATATQARWERAISGT